MSLTYRAITAIASALLLTLAAATLHAQPIGAGYGGPGPCAGPGAGPGMGAGRMNGPGRGMGRGALPVAAGEAALGDLRTRLGLAPAQQAAWQDFADRVKAQTERIQNMRQARPGASMDPTERLAFRDAMMKQRVTENAEINRAAQTLRGVLTPPQIQTLDSFRAAAPCPRMNRGGS
jgi:hypothetical protein